MASVKRFHPEAPLDLPRPPQGEAAVVRPHQSRPDLPPPAFVRTRGMVALLILTCCGCLTHPSSEGPVDGCPGRISRNAEVVHEDGRAWVGWLRRGSITHDAKSLLHLSILHSSETHDLIAVRAESSEGEPNPRRADLVRSEHASLLHDAERGDFLAVAIGRQLEVTSFRDLSIRRTITFPAAIHLVSPLEGQGAFLVQTVDGTIWSSGRTVSPTCLGTCERIRRVLHSHPFGDWSLLLLRNTDSPAIRVDETGAVESHAELPDGLIDPLSTGPGAALYWISREGQVMTATVGVSDSTRVVVATDDLVHVAISPDFRVLVTAESGGAVQVRDVDTGAVLSVWNPVQRVVLGETLGIDPMRVQGILISGNGLNILVRYPFGLAVITLCEGDLADCTWEHDAEPPGIAVGPYSIPPNLLNGLGDDLPELRDAAEQTLTALPGNAEAALLDAVKLTRDAEVRARLLRVIRSRSQLSPEWLARDRLGYREMIRSWTGLSTSRRVALSGRMTDIPSAVRKRLQLIELYSDR